MEHPGFFERSGPMSIKALAEKLGARVEGPDDRMLEGVATLKDARATELSFLSNIRYVKELKDCQAAACLLHPDLEKRCPPHITKLITDDPYRSFAQALSLFFPESRLCTVAPQPTDQPIHPSAKIEDGARIEPGAVIGPEAEIGSGTVIAANAVIGYRCTIGRDCYIGPNTTVLYALIGNRVTLHSGVRVGQDGFGFAMGRSGHFKVPQTGRVIIQDDVEVGANSAIDRGALKDTIIGEGTKIDNLVQIGHNAVIGRHCVIVGQTGIAGSAEIGDFVVFGGQSGVAGHLKVGTGAQIAGASHVKDSVPPGMKMAGTPAQPLRDFARELMILRRLTNEGRKDPTRRKAYQGD